MRFVGQIRMISVVNISTTEPKYGWYQAKVSVSIGPPMANTHELNARQAVTQWKVFELANPLGSVLT